VRARLQMKQIMTNTKQRTIRHQSQTQAYARKRRSIGKRTAAYEDADCQHAAGRAFEDVHRRTGYDMEATLLLLGIGEGE